MGLRFPQDIWKDFYLRISARGVTTEQITKLLSLADWRWRDEIMEVISRYTSEIKPANVSPTKEVVVGSGKNPDHAAKRAIMGSNFLGLEEFEKAFGKKWTPAQRAKLAVIPFSEEKLRACSHDTHVLVAGFPMSIKEIASQRRIKNFALDLFSNELEYGWCEREAFADIRVEVRWYLLEKHASYQGPKPIRFPPGEKKPWARDVAFAIILLYLITGERLFKNIYVECRDMTVIGWCSGSTNVRIGYFKEECGLRFFNPRDPCNNTDFGECSIQEASEN